MQINFLSSNSRNCQPIRKETDKCTKPKKQAFGSMHKIVNDNIGNIANRTHTWFFRFDLNWDNVVNYIATTFPNGAKIRNFACSDGSEPFSLAIKLMDTLGDKAKKYFPILAQDIDEDALAIAQKGPSAFGRKDRGCIKYFLKNSQFEDYFTPCEDVAQFHSFHHCPVAYYSPTKKLKDAVHFSKGDIIQYISQPKLDADVILARNFIPYLSADNQKLLLSSINSKMKPQSLFCVGDYDYSGEFMSNYHGGTMFKTLMTNFSTPNWHTIQGNDCEVKHFIHK